MRERPLALDRYRIHYIKEKNIYEHPRNLEPKLTRANMNWEYALVHLISLK